MVLAWVVAFLALAIPATSQEAASYRITRTTINSGSPRQQCTLEKGAFSCHAPSAGFFDDAHFSFDEDTKVFKLTCCGGWSYNMSLVFVAGRFRGSFQVLSGGPFEEEKLEYTFNTGICHNSVNCCSNRTLRDFGDACCNLATSWKTGTPGGVAEACYTFPGTDKWGDSFLTLDAGTYGKYRILSDYGKAHFSGTSGKFTNENINVVVNYQLPSLAESVTEAFHVLV